MTPAAVAAVAAVLLHREGMMQGRAPGAARCVFLNQLDLPVLFAPPWRASSTSLSTGS